MQKKNPLPLGAFLQSRASELRHSSVTTGGGDIASESVLRIPKEVTQDVSGNATQPYPPKASARVKTAAEVLANGVGVVGVCCFGKEAEPETHHKKAMQEGFEDYLTQSGIDSIPPWVGILIAIGAYVIFVLMTPKGRAWVRKMLGMAEPLSEQIPAQAQAPVPTAPLVNPSPLSLEQTP